MSGVSTDNAQAPGPPLRAYRSPVREQQARRTRRRILNAASGQFLDHGYAATPMRAVAAAADVSVPTVELQFGTKARLLKECIDVAIAGDDAPVAVLQRQWTAEAVASPGVPGFLRVVADVLCSAQARSAGLVLAAYEAAPGDREIAALIDQLQAQRTVTAAWILDGIIDRSPLRAGLGRAEALD